MRLNMDVWRPRRTHRENGMFAGTGFDDFRGRRRFDGHIHIERDIFLVRRFRNVGKCDFHAVAGPKDKIAETGDVAGSGKRVFCRAVRSFFGDSFDNIDMHVGAVDIDTVTFPNRIYVIDMPYQHSRRRYSSIPFFFCTVFHHEQFIGIFGVSNAVGNVIVELVQFHRTRHVEFCRGKPSERHSFECRIERWCTPQ